jgi:Acetyltransferases
MTIIENIDKLHTTPLGEERIRKNLQLQTNDVVRWCKETVRSADISIRQGKNWYVYKNGAVITINAHNFTIITAHKINAKIRTMQESDHGCLNEFLYQAIFIPEGSKPLPRSIISEPDIFIYVKDFGGKPGDLGVVAEQNGQIVGAAWTRIIDAFGHIDDDTPELAISILPEFRSYGIGTKLMKKLFVSLREHGYTQTSLSVQKKNTAVRFYQRLGYKIAETNVDQTEHEDFLMIKDL